MHRSVRSLSRGLALIRELNISGPSSALELARRSGLNRTTCYRLLQTLQHDGFVSFDGESALFSLTPKVRTLGEGASVRDLSSAAALPPMFALLEEVSWPSDFAVFELGFAMIHESTHSFSPLSIHRSMVGRRRPLLRSALGRAMLTAAPVALRREILEITASLVPEEAALARDRRFVSGIVARTTKDGYASSIDETEPGISAIALPIQGRGPVLGSLNIVFFSSAMTPEVAAKRYLGALSKAVKEIERRWQPDQDSSKFTGSRATSSRSAASRATIARSIARGYDTHGRSRS